MKKKYGIVALILLLCAAVVLFALFAKGCSTQGDTPEGTDPSATDAPVLGDPRWPDDLGVIVPLNTGASAKGLVWDMENTPDDLLEEIWATMVNASSEEFVEGNIQILGADGKGRNGSRALQIKQMGPEMWCDGFSLNMMDIEGYNFIWEDGGIMWLWIDATEFSDSIKLELKIEGSRPLKDADFYVVDKNGKAAVGGQLPEAWTGQTFARFPIKGGFKGFIGVSLDDFENEIMTAMGIDLYVAYDTTSDIIGKSLYVDDLYITDGEAPEDAEPTTIKGRPFIENPISSFPAVVWDMENLPADMVAAKMALPSYEGKLNKDTGLIVYPSKEMSFKKAANMGYNGSAALAITQITKSQWYHSFVLDMAADTTSKVNWEGAKTFWFWVDASDTSGVDLDLQIGDAKPAIGATIYKLSNGKMTEVKLEKAYATADYARIPVNGGWIGWIGIPLSAYDNTKDAGLITVFTNKLDTGKTMYLDEFTLSNKDAKTWQPEKLKAAGPHDFPVVVWDMEKLPDADLLSAGWANALEEGSKDGTTGQIMTPAKDVKLQKAAGKGYNDSVALGFTQIGDPDWADIFGLKLMKDGTAETDWTGAKMLWFWVNGEDANGVNLDLDISGAQPAVGATAYKLYDGKLSEITLEKAYGGADYARIPVAAGYTGWIGIPMSALDNVSDVTMINIYVNGLKAGKAFYFDQFTITDKMPDQWLPEELKVQEKLTFPAVVWDMENLPAEDLLSAGWATADHEGEKDGTTGEVMTPAKDVKLNKAANKGYDGSTALAINQIAKSDWADVFTVNLNKDNTAKTYWDGAKTLWFYVDASQSNDVKLELLLGGVKPAVGGEYYLLSGGAMVRNTLPKAWDTANYARIPISGGFVGWVGISMSAYNNVVDVSSITLYVNGLQAGKTFYMDQLTVSDKIPDDWMPEEGKEEKPMEIPGLAWDMENLPAEDLVSAGWAYADHEQNNEGKTPVQDVKLQKAEGKGAGGSTALAINQLADPDWADVFTLDMTVDETTGRNWSNGEMLWFWVSNKTDKDIRLELKLDGKTPSINYHYYSYANDTLTDLGKLPEAWDGQTYGRIPVTNGFEGYYGIPLEAFGDIGTVTKLSIYANGLPKGKTLYLDDIWVADALEIVAPDGGDVLDSTTILNQSDTAGAAEITIDTEAEHQVVKYFGASDAWWATGIGKTGTARAAIKLLYSNLGIALNNYRINVGGGVKEDHSDTVTDDWRAPESPLGENGTLDITRNEDSWAALTEVEKLGTITNYTLFMNTPPSTMMDNGKTYQGKLKAECYTEYAQYVADVVKLYLDAGIDVKYVSPINEPMLESWKTITTQECAVYTVDEIIAVHVEVIKALKAEGLTVKVSISEFNQWGVANEYLNQVLDGVLKNSQISAYAKDYVDHISAHSYGNTAKTKKDLAATLAAYNAANGTNITLQQTEWAPMIGAISDNMDTATDLARVMYEDLTILDVDTWSWWLGVSKYNYTDGLIYTNDSGDTYSTTKRMWAMGNYSKFVTGMTRIETDGTLPSGVYVSAYKDEASGELVYVLINQSDAAQSVKLEGVPAMNAQVWETSVNYNCQQIGLLNPKNAYQLPAKSVTTFVFTGVDFDNLESTLPGTPVWQMNDLPADLVSSSWAEADSDQAVSGNLTVTKVSGKGYDGGDALAIKQVGKYHWADMYKIYPTKDSEYKTAWNNQAVLWMWVDSTGVTNNNLTMELKLGDLMPKVGYGYYTMDAEGNVSRAGTLVKAYEGNITDGVLPIKAGYTGWIGMPLAAYGGISDVQQLRIHLRNASQNDVLYLDEFCVGTTGNAPALAAEHAAPVEGLISLFNANGSVGTKLAYANSNNRQAWVYGIEGAGGGAVHWQSQSYAAVQWISIPSSDITGATRLYVYVDNQSGYAISKLGLGLQDASGKKYEPGKNGNYGNKVEYGLLADGTTTWTTGKLDSWGWIKNVPQDFKGWIYVNITGENSYQTVFKTVNLDLTKITKIGIKAGEDKAYSVLFDCFMTNAKEPEAPTPPASYNLTEAWNVDNLSAGYTANGSDKGTVTAMLKTADTVYPGKALEYKASGWSDFIYVDVNGGQGVDWSGTTQLWCYVDASSTQGFNMGLAIKDGSGNTPISPAVAKAGTPSRSACCPMAALCSRRHWAPGVG